MNGLRKALSGRSLWITVGIVLLITVGGAGYWLGKSEDLVDDAGLVIVAKAEAQEVHPHAGKQKNPDGSWKYTNSLIHETSPYLLLHAHNPVNWYPWGPEALERARKESKPIFLSVGYSTCYWCHVMKRQVFSDLEIAELMNRWFINIKVDREERPDLDEIYMTATHLLTGSGGWPNSVFLTPELKPFFAGTYFPPKDRYGRPGFPKVLKGLHEAWEDRRNDVEAQAENIAANIRRIQEGKGASSGTEDLNRELVSRAIRQLVDRYESDYGGFGGAPKFPPSMDLELLMAEYERTGEDRLLKMVTHTLEMMARGGMYDHLGGGFHRYSTDGKWHVPHFEKMLYNQAQISKAYLHAYKLTGEDRFRYTAEDIFRFVKHTLTAPEGAFYSALDSETDGIEGKSYLWTEREIRKVLGKDADLFLDVYALAPMSEGDGKVIYMPRSMKESGEDLGLSVAALRKRLVPLKAALLEVRGKRERPLLDTKVLTAWNGLMIDAYAYGYEILKEEAYLNTSRKAAEFVLAHLGDGEGNLHRTYSDGQVKYDGYQEDYAFLMRGLIGLYRASGERRYLGRAELLSDRMVALFWDEEGGAFYFTTGKEHLIVRTKNPHDSAVPSGNSVAANSLLTLARETSRKDFLEKARVTMQAFAGSLKENPGAFKNMALAIHRYLEREKVPVFHLEFNEREEKISIASVPEGKDLIQTEAFVSVDRLVPGETFQVAVRLKITEGWHINANPASLDFLVPTTLEVNSDLPVDVRSVDYPPGKGVRFEFADEPLSVYEGETMIWAALSLDDSAIPADSGVLRLVISYQACDDQQCLLPTTIELPLEVRIAKKGTQSRFLHPEIFNARAPTVGRKG